MRHRTSVLNVSQLISVPQLLEAWETGQNESPTLRALRLLTAGQTVEPLERLAAISLGQRNARLLSLREILLGRRMEALAPCPACGETLEVVLDTEDLRAAARPNELQVHEQWRELPEHGVRVRAPNSADLLAVAAAPSREAAVAALVEQCVQPLAPDGGANQLEDLSAAILALDPLAELDLGLTCPVCNSEWVAPLDVAGFVWAEVDAWAHRTLREVHVLARTYGWSESEILQLAPRRRQTYLEMIGA